MCTIAKKFCNVINIPFLCVCFQGDVEEDEMIPDKESDIKPRFHKSRTHSNTKHDEGEVARTKFLPFLFRFIFNIENAS